MQYVHGMLVVSAICYPSARLPSPPKPAMYLTDFAAWACKHIQGTWPEHKLRTFQANLSRLGQYRYGSLCSGMDV